MNSADRSTARPWYREPWPWILMVAPATAVAGGAVTLWLAVSTSDGLVADDYYKQGLAINRVLHREEAAARLQVALHMEPASGTLTARLTGRAPRPEALFVQLAHATRAGNDLRLRLAHAGADVYRSELPPRAPGHWRVIVEDPRAEWRVAGEWSGTLAPFILGAGAADGRAAR